jgi:hypothetical protein
VKPRTTVLALAVAALYALHQDFWLFKEAQPLLFGFLPPGLAYHAAYTLLVAGLMAALVRWAWPADLEEGDAKDGHP